MFLMAVLRIMIVYKLCLGKRAFFYHTHLVVVAGFGDLVIVNKSFHNFLLLFELNWMISLAIFDVGFSLLRLVVVLLFYFFGLWNPFHLKWNIFSIILFIFVKQIYVLIPLFGMIWFKYEFMFIILFVYVFNIYNALDLLLVN